MEMLQVGSFQELLSHVFCGLTLKATLPRQHRMGANLRSYQSRTKEIASDLGEMVKGGHYKVRPLMWVGETGDARCDVWPTAFLPSYSAPMGGRDKPGKITEKRRLADGSAPCDVYERNQPEGPPDGPLAVDFNTLAGPMRPRPQDSVRTTAYVVTPYGSPCDCCGQVQVRDSTHSRHLWWGALVCVQCADTQAWEHMEPLKWFKENKHQIDTVYTASAVLGAVCDAGDMHLFAVQDDYRWMFWYFGLNPCEFPASTQYALAYVDGRLAHCLVIQLVADMGRSPISNVCSHVSLKHVASWAAQMDVVLPQILPRLPAKAQSLLQARADRLGAYHGRPFWGSSFTDDVILLNCGIDVATVATDLWDKTCYKANIRMTDFEKCVAGTAPLHIGARFVLNGHFGTVPPTKRARCLQGIRAALERRAECDAFESNCGLIGHIAQVLHIDRSLLHGIKRPLDIAAYPYSIIYLTAHGEASHLELEYLISTRNAASFTSAVSDATLTVDLPPTPTFRPVEIRMGSDACTGSDDVPFPAVFGMCHEFAYIFPLTGRWLEVPITGTESLGGALDFLVFAPLFPWARLVNETDASSTHAMLLGRSHTPALQRGYRVLREQPAFQEAATHSASQQVSGSQHVMVDAGSRGYTDTLAVWLAALNMHLHLITLTRSHLDFAESFLSAMLDGDPLVEEFTQDVAGDVAFYSDMDEVIRYASSPVPSHLIQCCEQATHPPASPLGSSAAPRRAPSSPSLPPQTSPTRSVAQSVPTPVPYDSPAPPAPLHRRPNRGSPTVASAPAPHSSAPPASPLQKPADALAALHERPRTAAAFRALGAARLADRLCSDSSPWRLCPNDPSLLHAAVMQVAAVRARAIPSNTDRSNDNGLRWFTRTCDLLGTLVERPHPAEADPEVEAFLAAYCVYYTAMEMKPAERSAVTRLGGVRKTCADPGSALSAYYGARRVLRDFGSFLPPMATVLQCLKGLRLQMIEDFGDDCFACVQAQPWPQHYLDKIMHGCSKYEISGWSPETHEDFLDAFVVSLNLGCRKVELPRYRLSNVAWLTSELVEIEPTRSNLAMVTNGHWLRMAPVCSKTDYDNAKYGSTRMWFRVNHNDPWSIASRLIRREQRSPVEPAERARTHLLLDRARNSGVTTHILVIWLDVVKAIYVIAAIAAFLTWHASRVTLASKLVKINRMWERVQTLVRWEGIASARIYGRAAAEAYSNDIAEAMAADAAGVARSGLPELDPVGALADIDAAIDSAATDATDAARSRAASAAELRNEPPAAVRPTKRRRTEAAAVPAQPGLRLTLADGSEAECHPSDSWLAVGCELTIPESVWGVSGSERHRYRLVGLSTDSGTPLYVAEALRGDLAGKRYLVDASVVRALMTTAMRKAAGARLRRPAQAV